MRIQGNKLTFHGILNLKKTDSLGYDTPGRLTHRGVWYSGESCFDRFFIDAPGYNTSGRLTRRGIIPGEIDSQGYYTPGRLTHQGIIPLGDWKIWITWWILNQNKKYFNSMVSGPVRFQLRKHWRLKISLDCLFNNGSRASWNFLHDTRHF